ncbi:hypothetical protein [Endothiovibrio diazotrophicus]
MNNKIKRSLLLLAAASLAGCATKSQYPLAETYPYATQQKMQAAHHWELLADDVAGRITTSLEGYLKAGSRVGLSCSSTACGGTVSHCATPFNQVFREMLITKLVEKGATVQQRGGADLDVEFHAQVLRHTDRGYLRPRPGTYTALAAGLWAVHDLAEYGATHDTAVFNLLGAGVLADIGSGYLTDTPDTEVIINVSVTRNDTYLFRKTGIYYINDGDDAHYQEQCHTPTRRFQVTDR